MGQFKRTMVQIIEYYIEYIYYTVLRWLYSRKVYLTEFGWAMGKWLSKLPVLLPFAKLPSYTEYTLENPCL